MSAPATEAPTTNPFVGPHALSEHDELFGRTLEVRMLRDLVIAERIVLLYSPSGAGKTSLLHAGLKRELIADGFAVLPTVRVTHEAPDALGGMTVRNRYSLSTLLSLEAGRDHEMDPATLADDHRSTSTSSRPARAAPTVGQDCLFFDQFEELFTADPIDVDAKREFLAELGEALRNRSRWAIISMREDFAAHLDPYLKLFPTRLRATFRLDLLGPQAAKAAILGPMSAARRDVRRRRRHGARRRPADRAACSAAAERRRRARPHGRARPAAGRLPPAVVAARRRHRDHHRAHDRARRRRRRPARLLRRGRRRGRRRHGCARAGAARMDQRRADHRAGLPRPGPARPARRRDGAPSCRRWRTPTSSEPTAAAAPSGTSWPTTASSTRSATATTCWLDRNLSDLQRGARAWEDQRRNDRALFVGDELQAVEAWATEHPDEVGESEAEFLAACRDEQQRIEKDARTRRRTRILAIAMTVVAGVAVVRARVQLPPVAPGRGPEGPCRGRRGELRLLLRRPVPRARLRHPPAPAARRDGAGDPARRRGAERPRRAGHQHRSLRALPRGDRASRIRSSEAIGATAMSADGSTLAVTTPDGVRVIDLDGAEPDRIVPVALGEEMLPAARRSRWTPTDRRSRSSHPTVASCSSGTSRRGPSRTWRPPPSSSRTPSRCRSPATTTSCSSASASRRSRCGTSTARPEVTPSSLSVPDALGLVISPSGALVATDGDGVVHINDLATGEERAAFEISGDVVAVDQAASRLIVTDYETFRVVDTVTGARTEQPPIPYVQVVAFAGDGDVLTIDATCVVRRWTSSSEQPVAESAVPGCRDDPFRATVGSDGDRMMVEGFGVGPWWTVVSLSEEAVLESSAVPEGTVAAGGAVVARIQDGRVVIGSPDGGGRAASIPDGPYQQVAVDAGGRAVVAAADDRLVVVDPESGEAVAAAELPWIPNSIAIGGGGTVVAASSEQGDVVRWQVAGDGRVEVLDAPGDSPIDGVAAARRHRPQRGGGRRQPRSGHRAHRAGSERARVGHR